MCVIRQKFQRSNGCTDTDSAATHDHYCLGVTETKVTVAVVCDVCGPAPAAPCLPVCPDTNLANLTLQEGVAVELLPVCSHNLSTSTSAFTRQNDSSVVVQGEVFNYTQYCFTEDNAIRLLQ